MGHKEWLTLREAAALLGVHPATLRQWADAGVVPSFRTPGGHRRFVRSDLEAFLRERSQGRRAWLSRPERSALLGEALLTTRERLHEVRPHALWWRAFDEETRARKRQEGRLLFSLALQYIAKPEERTRILEQVRQLGYRYGEDSVRFRVPLAETLRALFFFESALRDTLDVEGDLVNGQTPASLRVERGLEDFIREVIYAVVTGYEDALRRALAAEKQAAG